MSPSLRGFVAWVAASLVATASLGEARALAQPAATDSEIADQLFEAATLLVRKGDIKAACPKFEESQRLDPALGTQFNLARCYRQLGKLGSAWRNFRAVERLAHATGKTSREDAAHRQLDELHGQAPHLVFSVQDQDVTLSINGERVDRADWSYSALDPGEYVVEATAPTKTHWTTRLTVPTTPDGSGGPLLITVPPLAPAESQPRITIVKGPSPRHSLGLALGGVGVAGLVGAGVTGVLILNAKSTADEHCRPGCDPDGYDAAKRGASLVTLNYVAAGIGLAGVGLGAFFLLTSPSRPATKTTAAIFPLLLRGAGGLAAAGSF